MRYLLPFFVLLLPACSLINVAPPQPYPEIREDISDHRYTEALTEIDALSRNGVRDKELQRLRNEAIYQAFRFEQQTLAEATTRQDEGDWRGALNVLDDALQRYPESKTLQDARKEFRTRQEQQLASLDADLMLARANWLLEQKNILVKKRSLGGTLSRSESGQLASIDQELGKLQPPLVLQGEKALKSGKLTLAKRCLSLAEQIEKDESTRRLHAAVNKANRQHASRAKARQRKAQEREREALARKSHAEFQAHLGSARESLAKGDLVSARHSVTAAAAIDEEHPELKVVSRELRTQITARTDRLINEGSSLYRRGEFQEAQKLWAEAVRLDPDNTLAKARLERAERVVDKLNRLRQEQARQ